MNENPWNLRRPNLDHFREFRQLLDLQDLTRTWLAALERELPGLPKALSTDLNLAALLESISILDRVAGESFDSDSSRELDDYLDDQLPSELLASLERKVWAVHAWTLIKIGEEESTENRDVLSAILRQSSWGAGREASRKRWEIFPDEWSGDLRALFTAAMDSPFLKPFPTPSFVVKRSLPDEIELLLLRNPYLSEFQEVLDVAPKLLPLHEEWLRGFLFHLNSKIKVTSELGGAGLATDLASNLVLQKWSLLESFPAKP